MPSTKGYWEITVLTEPRWDGHSWSYNGVQLVSRTMQYGNSPVRDKKSRLEMISELAAAGLDFTVAFKELV